MYCMNCGAPNNDGAKFCVKCGQPMDVTPQAVSIEKATAQPHQKQHSKRYKQAIFVAIAIIAIIFATTKIIGKNNETKGFSLDAIVKQCPDCLPAIETYLALTKSFNSLYATEDDINTLVMQLSQQMRHKCTANVMQVESIPYAYNGSTGFYTGEWCGAGPTGNGIYNGAVFGKRPVVYEGDWGFGLPNGEGQLYIQDYMDAWDLTYTGEFKNGVRDGEGIWFENYDSPYHPHLFRVYDKAIYSNNQLTNWVNCTEYNAETQEIQKYYKMSTDERGYPIAGAIWGANEPSPEVKAMQDQAFNALLLGVTVYITGSMIKSAFSSDDNPFYNPNANPNSPEALNSWREQKAQQQAEYDARKAKEAEDYRYYCSVKKDECIPGSLDWQYFDANSY